MLFKVDEAARRLGVTPNQLRKMARSGAIPCVKYGTRYLFAESVIASYSESAPAPVALPNLAELGISWPRPPDEVRAAIRLVLAWGIEQLSDEKALEAQGKGAWDVEAARIRNLTRRKREILDTFALRTHPLRSVGEAARYLGVTPEQVMEWCKTDVMPHAVERGRYTFSRRYLDEFQQRSCQPWPDGCRNYFISLLWPRLREHERHELAQLGFRRNE